MIAAQTIAFSELIYALGLFVAGAVTGMIAQAGHEREKRRLRRMARQVEIRRNTRSHWS